MPRRNFYILFLVTIVGLACALQSDREGRLLTYAMRQIDQRHLEDVDRRDLFEGAMHGMTYQLREKYKDDYSAYVSPEEARAFNEELDQEFGGLGMNVTIPEETGRITVLYPLVDSPAYAAGIRAGDIILEIDGETTEDMTLKGAVKKMHGEPGESVTLLVQHQGEKEPTSLTVVRDIIQVDTVLGDRREPDGTWNYFLEGQDRIGYVRVDTIAGSTDEQLRDALDWLVERDMQGLIIDLRSNSGGYLAEAIAICDMFVDQGVIVSTRCRHGKVAQVFEAKPGAEYSGFPVAVLINKYSASAAEIIAACLQDHHCAVVVGQRSYGKGTVQEVLCLDAKGGTDRGLLKVTSASYWRPSEKNINRGKNSKDEDEWGVSPDKGYELVVDDEELMRIIRARRDREVEKVPGMTLPEKEEPADDSAAADSVKNAEESAQEQANVEESKPAEPKPDEPGAETKEADTEAKAEESKADSPEKPKGRAPFFDPQLDVAIDYLRRQIAEQQGQP